MYWKAWATSARSTPGERPGGCWGFMGSLTYTSAPLASSILPTQLVAVRGIPVTSSGGPPGGRSLPGVGLLDDLGGHVRRQLLVVGELARERPLAPGHRAQVDGVADRLGLGDGRPDQGPAGADGVGAGHPAAPRRQVAEDVADELVRHQHLQLEDG